MSRYVFKLPDVGEGTAEAEIVAWHVAVGDRIEEDQPLVDVTTDKAIVEIPAPVSGTVVSIHGAPAKGRGRGGARRHRDREPSRTEGREKPTRLRPTPDE